MDYRDYLRSTGASMKIVRSKTSSNYRPRSASQRKKQKAQYRKEYVKIKQKLRSCMEKELQPKRGVGR